MFPFCFFLLSAEVVAQGATVPEELGAQVHTRFATSHTTLVELEATCLPCLAKAREHGYFSPPLPPVMRLQIDCSFRCHRASQVAQLLCDEVSQGGCVDSSHQPLTLLYMTLCPEDVSRVRFGKLSPYTIEYLRHLKDFFGIVFKLKADAETQSVLVSCLGVGFKNLSKASF
jgi:hypothetical protein